MEFIKLVIAPIATLFLTINLTITLWIVFRNQFYKTRLQKFKEKNRPTILKLCSRFKNENNYKFLNNFDPKKYWDDENFFENQENDDKKNLKNFDSLLKSITNFFKLKNKSKKLFKWGTVHDELLKKLNNSFEDFEYILHDSHDKRIINGWKKVFIKMIKELRKKETFKSFIAKKIKFPSKNKI